MNIKIKIIAGFLLGVLFLSTYAQESIAEKKESKSTVDLGADLVSSYIWRGLQIDAVPNIQGWGIYSIGNLGLGAWVSSNFVGSYAETDFLASYTIGNFTPAFTHFFAGQNNFFNLKKETTTHVGELSLTYNLGEKIPLQFAVGTFIYGDDDKVDSYDQDGNPVPVNESNYSTYFEVLYSFNKNNTNITLTVGGVTHESYFYASKGFAIINTSIGASKAIKITDSFSLPIDFTLTVNPELESIYSAIKISF